MVLPHTRGVRPPSPLQHTMCAPHSCSSEQARGLLVLRALSPLPCSPVQPVNVVSFLGSPSSGFLFSQADFSQRQSGHWDFCFHSGMSGITPACTPQPMVYSRRRFTHKSFTVQL